MDKTNKLDRLRKIADKTKIKEMKSAIELARIKLEILEQLYHDRRDALIKVIAGEMDPADKQAEDTLSRVKRALADDNDDEISITLRVNKQNYTIDSGRIKELTDVVCNEFAPKALQLFVDKYDLEPKDKQTYTEIEAICDEVAAEAKPVVGKSISTGLKSISITSHGKSILVNGSTLYVDPVMFDKVRIAVENDDIKEVNRLTGFIHPIEEEQLKSIKVYPNVK